MELDLGLRLKTGLFVGVNIQFDVGSDICRIQHTENICQDAHVLLFFRLVLCRKRRDCQKGDEQAQRQQCRNSFSHNSSSLPSYRISKT